METVDNSPTFDWARARELLKTRLGSEVVSRWLDPLSLSSATEQAVVLEAPNPFFRDWVLSHYLEPLRALTGGRDLQIDIASASSLSAVVPSVVASVCQAAAPPAALSSLLLSGACEQ